MSVDEYTFTPPGSPPVTAGAASAASQSIQGQIAPANAGAASAQTAPAGASAILAALASMGKQAATAPPPTNYPAPSIQSVPAAYNPPVQPQVTPHIPQSTPMQNLPAQASSTTGAYGQTPQQLGVPPNQPNPPVAAAVNPLALIAGLMQQAQAQQVQAPQVVAPSNDAMALQLQLLQGLASGQVPQEQIPQVLAALGISQNSAAPAINSAVPNYPLQNNQLSRDAYGSSGGYDQARYRDRSRSPESRYRNVSPPARRDSPTYGVYKAQSDAYGNDRRGKVAKGRSTRTDYRQRSPVGRGGRQETPTSSSRAPQTKWIEYDQSMPEGHIKGEFNVRPPSTAHQKANPTDIVLSRTLFVGGVT